jgi:hypothetical protein
MVRAPFRTRIGVSPAGANLASPAASRVKAEPLGVLALFVGLVVR